MYIHTYIYTPTDFTYMRIYMCICIYIYMYIHALIPVGSAARAAQRDNLPQVDDGFWPIFWRGLDMQIAVGP